MTVCSDTEGRVGTNWDAAAAPLSLSLYSASSAGGVALVVMATLSGGKEHSENPSLLVSTLKGLHCISICMVQYTVEPPIRDPLR